MENKVGGPQPLVVPLEARFCTTCEHLFEVEAKSRRSRCDACRAKHPSGHRPGRQARKRAQGLRFVGVDGEGVGEGADHRYVLLTVGEESIEDPEGLSFEKIMAFLWKCHRRDPQAVFVGYFLGYDFAQWFRDLPEERAKWLILEEYAARRHHPVHQIVRPVGNGRWEFDILGTKRFKLRAKGYKGPWMYVCDVGPFFQTSLVKAIDPKKWPKPVVSDSDFQRIVEGKARRATAELDDEMREYNKTENKALAALMGELDQGLREGLGVTLPPTRWFGPGQAAQAWMESVDCPTSEDVKKATPEEVTKAARASYYGGWFEIFAHGRVLGTSWAYDINSAYPHIISQLPCLLHGRWRHTAKPKNMFPADKLCLVRAEVASGARRMGTLPYRTPKGRILRPRQTSGWYWGHEIAAAQRAGAASWIRVHEYWTYTPCKCPPPLRAIADLYDKRVEAGKNTPEGKAFKLVYNSVYGKLAQSVGYPKFSNAIYASLVTSGCRTQILDAIAKHPRKSQALLMVATDGVYFEEPHPKLTVGKALGEWEVKKHENLCLHMPGIYWDDATRARLRDGKDSVLKARGIGPATLAKIIPGLDKLWDDYRQARPGRIMPNCWPVMTLPAGGYSIVSPKQALRRGKWEQCGRDVPSPYVINADPHEKRALTVRYTDRYMWTQVIDPSVWPFNDPERASYMPPESTPYEQKFGDEMAAEKENEALDGDGYALDYVRELMQGE